MKKNKQWLCALCCCSILVSLCLAGQGLAAPSAGDAKAVAEANYKIGAGDVLQISVWKDTALSREVVVLPDGTISLPLVGLLKAAGKTVSQLEAEVTVRIKKYMSNPILDISVGQVNSMVIYVIGKVRAPGRFPLATDINVLQALAMAGGPDKFADTDDIKIYRAKNGQTQIIDFDYEDVLDGESLEQNIRLLRGDVVVVP